jgi:acetyl esterase/lipase
MHRRAATLISVLLLAFAATSLSDSARAEDATACSPFANVVDAFTIAYGKDAKWQSLDMYLPDGIKGEPLVVFVHGGAWRHGDKSQYDDLARAFAACGVGFAVVNYTLAGGTRADAQAADVANALKYIRDGAGKDAYGDRIFLFGHSAGAQLAAYLMADGGHVLGNAGLSQRAIAGVIVMEGTGFEPRAQTRGIALNPLRMYAFSSAFGSDPSAWGSYDVRQYVTGHEPPVLVVHAVGDTIAPEYESADLVKTLKNAGDRVTYLQPQGRDHFGILHEMTDGSGDPILEAVLQFVLSS